MPNYSCVPAIHPTVEFLVVNVGFTCNCDAELLLCACHPSSRQLFLKGLSIKHLQL